MKNSIGWIAPVKKFGNFPWKKLLRSASFVALVGLTLQIFSLFPDAIAGLDKWGSAIYVVCGLLLGVYGLVLNVAKQPTAVSRSCGRWAIICGGTIFVSVIAIVLQIVASVSAEVPGWSKGAIGANLGMGLFIAAYGFYLSTDNGAKNENPKIVKAIAIALAIYTVAQAVVGLMILGLGK